MLPQHGIRDFVNQCHACMFHACIIVCIMYVLYMYVYTMYVSSMSALLSDVHLTQSENGMSPPGKKTKGTKYNITLQTGSYHIIRMRIETYLHGVSHPNSPPKWSSF